MIPCHQQVCNLPSSYYDRQEEINQHLDEHGCYPEIATDQERMQYLDGLVNPTDAELQGRARAPSPNPFSSSSSDGSAGFFRPGTPRPFVRRRPASQVVDLIDTSSESSSSSTSSRELIALVTSRRRTGISGQSRASSNQRPQSRERQRRTPTEGANHGRQCVGNFIGNPDGERALEFMLDTAQRAGWSRTLVHGMRGTHLREVLPSLFSSERQGPLAQYQPFQASQLAKKFREAMAECKDKCWDRQGSHSSDATGAEGETIPKCAKLFQEFFQYEENQQSQNQATAAARRD